MKDRRIALFVSTHEAMKGETLFREHHIPFRPVIAPKQIVSGCSMGLEFPASHTQVVLTLREQEGLRLKIIEVN